MSFIIETFRAEPLSTEDAYRVIGSAGTIMAYRLDKDAAEKLAAGLNADNPTLERMKARLERAPDDTAAQNFVSIILSGRDKMEPDDPDAPELTWEEFLERSHPREERDA
jgi:hypothetical protein